LQHSQTVQAFHWCTHFVYCSSIRGQRHQL